MSETSDALKEALSTAALLSATLQTGTEAAGLYNETELADMLVLQAERVVLILDAENCCGGIDGPMCGCCNSRLNDAAFKAGQICRIWEKAA